VIRLFAYSQIEHLSICSDIIDIVWPFHFFPLDRFHFHDNTEIAKPNQSKREDILWLYSERKTLALSVEDL